MKQTSKNILTAIFIAAIIIFVIGFCVFGMANASTISLDAGTNIINKTGSPLQEQHYLSFVATENDTSFSLGYSYTKTGELTTENEIRAALGCDYWLKDDWEIWVYGSGAKDRAIDKFNYDAGGGLKYVFCDTEQHFSISGGYIVSYLAYLDVQEYVDRWSIRPKLKLESRNWQLKSIVFYQPSVDDVHDYIIKGFVETRYKLSKRTGLKLRFENEYIAKYKYNKAKTMLLISVKLGG